MEEGVVPCWRGECMWIIFVVVVVVVGGGSGLVRPLRIDHFLFCVG